LLARAVGEFGGGERVVVNGRRFAWGRAVWWFVVGLALVVEEGCEDGAFGVADVFGEGGGGDV
jgi:hypothetical protein